MEDDEDTWSCYDGVSDEHTYDHTLLGPGMPRLCDKFRKTAFVARGAQGALYLARFRRPAGDDTAAEGEDAEEVCVKRLFLHHHLTEVQGCPTAPVREVTLLRRLHHPNVISLIDVVAAPHQELCLVLERVDTDLERLVIKSGVRLTGAHLKHVVRSLLEAVAYLASQSVLHRDIKPSNVGVTRAGVVKLLDFGSSRPWLGDSARYSPVGSCTTLVFSPPELLLGSHTHTPAVDVWGVGMVMAEMARGKHLFQAHTQLEVLAKIFALVGTPSAEAWSAISPLTSCRSVTFQQQPNTLEETFVCSSEPAIGVCGFKYLSPVGVDLLSKLLDPNPSTRITAAAALTHPWFTSETPAACTPAEFAPLLSAAPSAYGRSHDTKIRPQVGGRSVAMSLLCGDDDSDDDAAMCGSSGW